MIIYYTTTYSGRSGDSHKLLGAALAAQGGDSSFNGDPEEKMQKKGQGKPFIEGVCPFSISHTNHIWAVLFAESECGLDIQLERDCDIIGISQRLYAREDALTVSSELASGQEKGNRAFFRIWTRREALAKMMAGSAFDPKLPAVPDDIVAYDGKEYVIKDFFLPEIPELHAAVCMEKGSFCDNNIIEFMKLEI